MIIVEFDGERKIYESKLHGAHFQMFLSQDLDSGKICHRAYCTHLESRLRGIQQYILLVTQKRKDTPQIFHCKLKKCTDKISEMQSSNSTVRQRLKMRREAQRHRDEDKGNEFSFKNEFSRK